MASPKRARRRAAPKPGATRLTVLRVLNPFNPRQYVREEIDWKAQRTLAEYFPLGMAEQVVSVNGKIIRQAEFGVTYLERGDNLVLCPIPAGDDGKQILAIVAMIAIAVIAPELAGPLYLASGGSMALASAPLALGMIQAGIVVAGSLLVHAIFAPSKPTGSSAAATSTSYGIDGAKNTSTETLCVPVCYGAFRMAGNILDLYVDNSGNTQILYMLINAGEGPVASISAVELNGNPLSDYQLSAAQAAERRAMPGAGTDLAFAIEVQTRLGLPDQAPLEWFNNVVVPQSLSHKLTDSWFTFTTVAAVDKLRADLVAPGGLATFDTKSGQATTCTVEVALEYRAVADGPGAAWNSFASPDVVSYDDATFSGGTWRDSTNTAITNPTWLEYLGNAAPAGDGSTALPVYSGALSLSGNVRTALRKSFSTGVLANGHYEVRMRRVTPKSNQDNVIDDVYVADLNEIEIATLSYPNTALLALKITLGDLITSLPQVTFINGGKLIDVYGVPPGGGAPGWYTAPSANPAWIAWDILTQRRYGGALPAARLDFPAWRSFADFCSAEALAWNGPIDSVMNVWDACQLVLRLGHAQIVNVGTRYTVIVERAADPVMMFSVANMIEGSYKETWLGTADRANEIDVTFFDRLDSYKQRTVKVYDPSVLATGAPQRTSAITLYGVVDEAVAYKEGQFQLNLNRFILKTVEFAAPLEAIACTVGDLILVQNDMTDWAVAGRFGAGSSSSVVQLDREVAMVDGKAYKLLVLHDRLQRAAGVVTSVAGTSLFLTGFDGTGVVKRIVVGGLDLRVAGTFNAGGSYGVVLDTAAGVTAGMAYVLWDTDVIGEYAVVTAAGSHAAVTTTAPMPLAPAQFGNWMFGETTRVKQPFRVRKIGADASGAYSRTILAIQYSPAVYDYARFTDVPVIAPGAGVIGPVRDLQVYEETYVAGAQIVSRVVAGWQAPITGMYAGADIYLGVNGAPLVQVASVSTATGYLVAAARGDTVVVRVVAYDLFGKRSDYSLAPQVSYVVIGELTGIEVGGVTGAAFYWSGRDCKISWRYNATTHSYEFGSEPVGGDAGALDPHFKDYEVRVYDAAGTRLRRTDYVTANSYTYIYDKNFADGLARHLKFEVRMRDIFNNLGEPATLDAANPAPLVTSANTVVSFESATVAYQHNDDPDFAGALIWLSRTRADLADPLDNRFLVYQGPDSAVLLPGLMFNADYYLRIAAYDAFGATELVPSAPIHFRTAFLNVDAIAEGVLDGSKLIPELQDRIGSISGAADAILAEALARGAAITEEATIRQTADASLADQITLITASVGGSAAAAIEVERLARVDADGALAAEITTLAATVDGNTAAILSEQSARATADGAIATDVTTLQTTVAGHTAAISSHLTSLNGLEAQYTLKIDLDGYLAGFGLGAYTNNDGSHTSEFIIRADTFAMVMPSYPSVHPFTIGVVGGVPRVIISNALIGDASINNAMIGNAEVNTLSVAGGAITANVFAYGSGTTMSPGGTFGAASGSVTLPLSNSGVIINVSIGMDSASYTTMLFHIERNGTAFGPVYGASLQGGYEQNLAFSVGDAPGAGTFTYQLVCVNVGPPGVAAVNIGNNSITIMGCKR